MDNTGPDSELEAFTAIFSVLVSSTYTVYTVELDCPKRQILSRPLLFRTIQNAFLHVTQA